MTSEEKARATILDSVRPLSTRRLSILRGLDCFAGQDYFARVPLPLFDNSAMDGYAVMASDCAPGSRLRVIAEQPAGFDRHLRVAAGEAVRIFTGAPLPQGADAVVMQEDVTADGNEVVVNVHITSGEFVRRRGCDLGEGQKVIRGGERVRAVTLGLLASQGLAEIVVGGEVQAAIISTGDELARPGDKLEAGQIYESNSVLLGSLLQRCGAKLMLTQHCTDDATALREAFHAATKYQVFIVSGGVSVGKHDLVQQSLRDLGAQIDIWRVAIKPGKPFLFGRLENCLVFGLPGNPVSAFITFLKFVRPAILKLMGAGDLELPTTRATLVVDLANESDRVHYIRGKLEHGNFAPVGRQESHALFGLSQSNALLRLPVAAAVARGATVDLEIWD
ncbi:MAG TPA: gephyrin-like molybdotransferase Glp [Chthoniobacterales bacterium]|nr:gephyrin-like molybdotransferase Glp [Chthoniobacterales bacterium]